MKIDKFSCEIRSVGWLLEETMSLPGMLTLWILGRLNIKASGFGILM